MMGNQKHIINKVNLEVNTSDTKMAYYLKDTLDVFMKKSLLPTIQAYFNSITATTDDILRFDTLELNIQSTDIKDEVQLQLAIIKSLQQQIQNKKSSNSQISNETDAITINTERNNVAAFLYFLETGQNPWWDANIGVDFWDELFISKLVEDENTVCKLKKLLQLKSVRQRLIYQFTDELLTLILSINQNTSSIETRKENIVGVIKKYKLKSSIRNQYWESIVKYVANKDIYTLRKELISLFKNDSVKHKNSAVALKFLDYNLKKIQSITYINERTLEKIKANIQQVFKNKYKISFDQITKGLNKEEKRILERENIRLMLQEAIQKCSEAITYKPNRIIEEMLSATSVLISEPLDLIKNEDTAVQLEGTVFEEESNHEEVTNELYIQNAGLVVLHPYISRFFTATKITDDTGKIKKGKEALAVHVLHYVATKKEQQPESNLVFEKFLCGYPITKAIPKSVRLSKAVKNEAESLLTAVLKNWNVLKNTSPDGLREGFIQRNGKLIVNDPAKYRIRVERKTQDILLEQLPWNLTVIKLPWLDRLIFTEW